MNFPVPCRSVAVAITITASVCAAIAAAVLYRRAKWKAEEDSDLFEGIVAPSAFDSSASRCARPPQKKPNDIPAISKNYTASRAPVLFAEREAGLQLGRELLRQLTGDEELSIEGKSEISMENETDETNVSLNYHIATEIEKEARDSLIQAVVVGEMMKATVGAGAPLSDFEDVIRLAVDYLEISNEREKLRARRCAATVRETNPVWPMDTKPDRQALAAGLFSRVSEMDDRLAAPLPHDAEERFEMGWDEGGAGDSYDDEAEFMAYLDQSDSAGYGSRMEARLAAMMDNNMHLLEGEDEEAYYDYDEDGEEEGEEGEEEDDEEDMFAKAEFERMVLDKLQQLATSAGVSAPHQSSIPAARNVVEADGDEEDEWDTEEDNDSTEAQ